jgi:cytochrome P450
MMARRDDPFIPDWSRDQLGASCPPEVEAPYFDKLLNAWVFSKHADILAAFRASSLSPSGPRPKEGAEPFDENLRLKMRAETMEALAPAQLRAWRAELAPQAQDLAGRLPIEEPLDLIDRYANPLCLSLAAMVTGISRNDAEGLFAMAQQVSAASAEPHDPDLRAGARSAKAALRGRFQSGPEPLRESGFVALSQTTPCLLGNAWFALIQHPQAWRLLHQHRGLTEHAIQELLRYAGLVRTLYRTATVDIDLNGCFIRKGEQIILRIIAANHDPDRFACPSQVDFTRGDGGHLTLGAGPHSCVAAGLICMAAVAITAPLLQRFASANLASRVEWRGGSGFRSPRSLWVCLTGTEV